MRVLLLIFIAMIFAPFARAHDPYEITSEVYVRSNRIELFVEMEFPAGMTLAGVKPSREVAAETQFSAALSQLRDLAGNFFDFTAGNNVVPALATNVQLGVENHIRLHVEYAHTRYRPLRFVARGLMNANASGNPYGTSLTVLDMVNQKVLGQATLFVGVPTAEFPPKADVTIEAETPVRETVVAVTNDFTRPNSPSPAKAASTVPPPKAQTFLPMILLLLVVAFFITFVVFRRRE